MSFGAAKIVGLVLGTAALVGLAACASEPSPALRAATVSHPHAAEIWADKCGSCHVPVEPGTRPRAVIEAAMARHQKRARLSAAEWRDLVEFLAATDRTAQNSAPEAPANPAAAQR